MVTLNKNNHAWIAQALGGITMSDEQENIIMSQTTESFNGAPTKSETLRPSVVASLPAVAVASPENLTKKKLTAEEYRASLEDLKRRSDNFCTSLGSMLLNLERTQPNSKIPPEIKQGLINAQEQIPQLGQQGLSTLSAAPR